MATDTRALHVPQPIEPGDEMTRLARFYPDITWEGRIEEGGMGPGTPEMTATGSGVHQMIQDGRWIVGTYEQDQFLRDGSFVLKWQLHWVVGWDAAHGEYRATHADSYGNAGVMRGWIDGERLTFETIGDAPVRLRMVWDATRPDAIRWRNEMSAGGGPYTLVEEYRCTPMSPSAPKAASTRRAPRARYNVTVKHLLDAGLIRPGTELRQWYLGRDLTATVEPDGRVRVGGEVYNSLSIAAGAARVAVKGPPEDGRRYYHTNGWTFWEYTDGKGRRRPMKALRKRYLVGRSSPSG
jgi:Restriction Enzyme Adenine Methylase Associated/Protein of unknown function (DUF1579)